MSSSLASPDAPAQRTFSDSYIKLANAPEPFVYFPPTPPLVSAVDDLRFDDIAESADLAEGLARHVAEAADRGERLKVRAYAGLLSRAVRNMLLTVSELGSAS
jgi:hypothetical protein